MPASRTWSLLQKGPPSTQPRRSWCTAHASQEAAKDGLAGQLLHLRWEQNGAVETIRMGSMEEISTSPYRNHPVEVHGPLSQVLMESKVSRSRRLTEPNPHQRLTNDR
jgi:hypothetical protein